MADTERFDVELPRDLAEFIRSQVGQGALRSDGDVMREALRVLRWQVGQDGLGTAWAEGLASGDAGPLDFGELRLLARRRLADPSV